MAPKIIYLFLCIVLTGCHTKNIGVDYCHTRPLKDSTVRKHIFSDVKAHYDTLIPIMNGLFIAYDSFDYSAYERLIQEFRPKENLITDSSPNNPNFKVHLFMGSIQSRKSKKWGVIDSANNIIIPFICDAVRELENGEGVFSIYKESYSLNTGIPRYNYIGYYYFFNSAGTIKAKGTKFTITTIFVGDFHNDEFVIENGNTFYFPGQFYIPNKKARGAASEKLNYEIPLN